MYYIGVDLGGTSIKAGLVDENGNILNKVGCPTAVERGHEAVMQDIAMLAKKLIEESGHDMSQFKAIGVGIPGVFNPKTNRIAMCTNLGWENIPIIEPIRKIVDLPVFVDNDATVAGIAEFVSGVSKGMDNSIFLTLGTGVGAGIIINGKPYSGSHGAGSELGHMIVQCEDGIPCSCGNVGCVDRYCSATTLIRDGRALMAQNPDCALAHRVCGNPDLVTAKDVIDLAKDNDPDCTAIFDRFVKYLVATLVTIIHSFDPEIIVIGGGVSHAGQFLLDVIEKQLANKPMYKTLPYADIALASLGNDAGIIGAAMLAR